MSFYCILYLRNKFMYNFVLTKQLMFILLISDTLKELLFVGQLFILELFFYGYCHPFWNNNS